jgi:hypothetical protein
MKAEIQREGFWKSNQEPDLPMPEARDKPSANQNEVLLRLMIKQGRAQTSAYRGWSTCRICGCANGNEEFKLGGWVWPSGLEHYVREHNVRLSAPFKTFLGV